MLNPLLSSQRTARTDQTGLKPKLIKFSQAQICFPYTVKPVLSDHKKKDIFLAFHTGGWLLLFESSAESSCTSFLYYFHSTISSHLSIAISMIPEWMVA